MRGGGCTGGINTEGGGGDQRVHARFGRINQNTFYAYPSEAPGSSQSSCLISWLISNVSLLLFN